MGFITRVIRSLFPSKHGLISRRGYRGAPACSIFRDHSWNYEPDNMSKRTCFNCGAQEWMYRNQYPAIGEPEYEWVDMTMDNIKLL